MFSSLDLKVLTVKFRGGNASVRFAKTASLLSKCYSVRAASIHLDKASGEGLIYGGKGSR